MHIESTKFTNKMGKSVSKKRGAQACTILITCGQPSADGKMSVEMTYEGDPLLASYLLENAQGLMELEMKEEE
jgi:hypothetical protein